jgi:macrodomain Ter protein organizer (MatP/YcbG family)
MNKKLTISVDDATIERAKQFAKSKGQSLSEIIENYLKLIPRKTDKPKISSKVSDLKGVLKLSNEINYKDLIGNSIAEKYAK